MRKFILIIFLLAFYSVSYAEDVVTYTGTTVTGCRPIGDTNVFLTNPNDYSTIKLGYVYLPNGCRSLPQAEKYLKIVNGQVVEMTQAEKDTVDAQLQAAQDAAVLARRQQLGNRIATSNVADFNLTGIDNAIDNIQNLADAKVFLKKLVRGVIKLNEGNQ